MWGYIEMHRLMPGYVGYRYRAPGSSFLDCRESQMQGQMEHETEAEITYGVCWDYLPKGSCVVTFWPFHGMGSEVYHPKKELVA